MQIKLPNTIPTGEAHARTPDTLASKQPAYWTAIVLNRFSNYSGLNLCHRLACQNNSIAALTLALGCLVTTAVALIGIDLTPIVWQDEVQIIDYGRCLLSSHTDWALTLGSDGRPVTPLVPMYMLVQQGWFAAVGTTIASCRLLSLASAVLAVLAMYYNLRNRAVCATCSAFIALLFLVDPQFARSYFGGRADAFAVAVGLLAGTIWLQALRRGQTGRSVCSGVLAAIALLTWPTVAATLVISLCDYVAHCVTRRKLALREPVLAMVGFIGIAVAVQLGLALADHDSSGDKILVKPWSLPEIGTIVRTVADVYVRSPWLLLLFVAAFIFCLAKRAHFDGVSAIILATLLTVAAPQFYSWRIMYLIPVCYILLALAWSRLDMPAHYHFSAAAMLFVMTFGINIVGRVALAHYEHESRDYSKYHAQLKELIPTKSVVVGDWSCYYAGLAEDWRMFVYGFDEAVAERFDTWYLVRRPSHEQPPAYRGFRAQSIGKILLGQGIPMSTRFSGYDREIICYERARNTQSELTLGEGRPDTTR